MLEWLKRSLLWPLAPRNLGVTTQDRVAKLLARPFIHVNPEKTPPHIPEHRFLELASEKKFPAYLMRELRESRIIAYADGKDRLNYPRVAVLYYRSDDMLVVTDVQDSIPQTNVIGPETPDDSATFEAFYSAGFVPYIPSWAYPLEETL